MTRISNHILTLAVAFAGTLFTACDKQPLVECTDNQGQEISQHEVPYYAPAFPKPDKSTKLTGTPAQNLKTILEATGPSIINSMGRMMNITDAQYEEIKTFTTNLVKNKPNQTEQYREIFSWIVSNIKYELSDPDPYAVFKNKKCVCQGYANLLTVMCHTQGIPTVVINGFLNMPNLYGGHAWAYTNTDGNWEVSDPTNVGSFPMSNIGDYTHLLPSEADVDLFADDCAVYRYYDYRVNVDRVVAKSNPLVVPYSAGGFVIGSFNPSEALPEEVKDIYLGENIETLGETYNMKLYTSNFGKHIQAIHVDENNRYLMSHKGVVYKRNGDENQLYYIPGGMKLIELLPMSKVEKNTIYNHSGVEIIYFPKGTKSFEGSAIENCPNLKQVYIPEDADWNEDALWNCPNDVEVILGEPSSVKHVTM